MSPTVGFVGLGQMGGHMAGRLTGWPGGLVVHDVRPAAAEALDARGARVVGSVADVATTAEIVSVMVLDDDQVRDVVGELLAAARPGLVIAVHSTIAVKTAVELGAIARAAGVELLDAPVSGGTIGASTGRLAVMVGGDRTAYERCREVFRQWAELVVHVGETGAGTRAKLARNLLGFVGYAAAAESQRLAAAAGVDLRKLGAVVRHTDAVTGGPGAIMLRDTVAPLDAADPLYDVLAHTRRLGEKDLELALDLGNELEVDLPLARSARRSLAADLGLCPTEVTT